MRQTEPESPNVIRFSVKGNAPSKSNFRRSGKDWRARWSRIKTFEALVGWEAKAAGAKMIPDSVATVYIYAYGQRTDADNILKSSCDGLKGVAFVDDSREHLEGVMVMHRPDDGGGKRLDFEIKYVGRSTDRGKS